MKKSILTIMAICIACQLIDAQVKVNKKFEIKKNTSFVSKKDISNKKGTVTDYTHPIEFNRICANNNICNLITNGDIKYFWSSIITNGDIFNPENEIIACWESTHGKPFMIQNNTTPPHYYSKWIKAIILNARQDGSSGICQFQNITKGYIYILSYQYQVKNSGIAQHFFRDLDNLYVKLANLDNSYSPGNFPHSTPNVHSQTIDHKSNIAASNSWKNTTKCFKSNDNYNAIWFHTQKQNSSSESHVRIMNIELLEIGAGDDITVTCPNLIRLGYGCPNATGCTYSWSPTTGLNNPNILNPTLNSSMLSNGQYDYQLSVTTPCGDVLTDNIMITITSPNISLSVTEIPQTTPCSKKEIVINVNLPFITNNISTTYLWYFPGMILNSNSPQAPYFLTETTTISVKAIFSNGCSSTASVTIPIDYPVLNPDWEFMINSNPGNNYHLTVIPSYNHPDVVHQWNVYETDANYRNSILKRTTWHGQQILNFNFQYNKNYMIQHGVVSDLCDSIWKDKYLKFYISR